MPYCSVYLPKPLETLLETESAAQGLTPGRYLVRTLVCALTGAEGPKSPTRRVVETLQHHEDGLPLSRVVEVTGLPEQAVRETLQALADLRYDGMPLGVVRLQDRAGVAIWSLAA